MTWNVTRLSIFSLVFLVASGGSVAAAQGDAQRTALRSRIDLSRSRIVLAASPGSTLPQASLDARTFVSTVQRLTGAKEVTAPSRALGTPGVPTAPALDGVDSTESSDRVFDSLPRPGDASCAVVRASTELHDIEVHMSDGGVLVRGADSYRRGVASPVRDEAVLAQAMELATALGAVPREARSEVRIIAAASRLNRVGALPGPAVPLGKKVFLERVLGSVEIAGQRLVMTFNLDGRLRKVRGRWTPIDYARSRLRSELTQAQFIERALDALVNAKVSGTNGSLPILLFTYFKPGAAQLPCGPVPIELRGAALVENAGPDGANPVVSYDFAL